MPQMICACGTNLQYPDAHAGKKIRCPRCQAVVQTPVAEPPPAEAIMALELVPDPPAQAYSANPRPPRDDYDDRPRRTRNGDRRWPDPEPLRPSSGKATVSLILGILSLFVSLVASIPSILLGILALRDCAKKNLSGRGVAITGIVLSLLLPLFNGLAILGIWTMQERAKRTHVMNNLKQQALAWHNYHDTFRRFPSLGTRFENGAPILPPIGIRQPEANWRVQVLPFIEQAALFQRFQVQQPWDGPANAPFQAMMPMVYEHRLLPQPPDRTLFQTTEGPDALLQPGAVVQLQRIMDGTSNTFMILEGAQSVVWSEPKDLLIQAQQPLPLPAGQFLAAMADGSVRIVDRGRTGDATLRLLINPKDGHPVPMDF